MLSTIKAGLVISLLSTVANVWTETIPGGKCGSNAELTLDKGKQANQRKEGASPWLSAITALEFDQVSQVLTQDA